MNFTEFLLPSQSSMKDNDIIKFIFVQSFVPPFMISAANFGLDNTISNSIGMCGFKLFFSIFFGKREVVMNKLAFRI
jgi:hypothetical protein